MLKHYSRSSCFGARRAVNNRLAVFRLVESTKVRHVEYRIRPKLAKVTPMVLTRGHPLRHVQRSVPPLSKSKSLGIPREGALPDTSTCTPVCLQDPQPLHIWWVEREGKGAKVGDDRVMPRGHPPALVVYVKHAHPESEKTRLDTWSGPILPC